MRIFKSHPLLKLMNSYIIDSPQPSNISYLWNFGSLLAFCLIIQIVTGVTLAMHYNPSVLEAFNSIEHIMRDVNNGWLIRYLHSNTASAFFFLVYLHIGRGLYYGSYKSPRTLVWTIGTIILVLMMATAFLGLDIGPKWFNLVTFSLQYINQYFYIISSIIQLLFFISIVIFYLDNYKLSSFKYIKFIQLFSLLSLILIFIYIILVQVNIDILLNIKDDNNVDLHGHVTIGAEAAKELSKGMTVVGSQLGLGATMAGVGTAVGKAIAKSGMPPVQKAGIIAGTVLLSGYGHSMISAVNRKNIDMQNQSFDNNNISKLIDNSNFSPLETILYDMQGISITCLALLFILIIQIVFKLYLKDNINLNLSYLLGDKFNKSLEYYINKIINLNKKMSVIYIYIILILLTIGLLLLNYGNTELLNNIDTYILNHNNIKK